MKPFPLGSLTVQSSVLEDEPHKLRESGYSAFFNIVTQSASCKAVLLLPLSCRDPVLSALRQTLTLEDVYGFSELRLFTAVAAVVAVVAKSRVQLVTLNQTPNAPRHVLCSAGLVVFYFF